MQDVLTIIASSSNPHSAIVVLKRLAVIAPDETRFARAQAAAEKLAQRMHPNDAVDSEANSYDKHHIDWYIGDAMTQLIDGESDDLKRAQYRGIKNAFDLLGYEACWRMIDTLDSIVGPKEFLQAMTDADADTQASAPAMRGG